MNIFGISRDPNTLRYIKTMQKDVLCVCLHSVSGVSGAFVMPNPECRIDEGLGFRCSV